MANVRPVFADHGIDVRQSLVRLIGGLAEIFQERLYFLREGVYVTESRFHLGTVFFNHASGTGECGGKVQSILRTKQIIHTRDCLLHLRRSIIQIAKQFLRLGPQVINLCGQNIEVDVLLRGKQGAA